MLYFIYFLFYLFIFLFGVTIGSFLNVVIYRVPQGISIAKGRSYCPACNNTLKSYDLIPILSYLFLKGRCRFCKVSIPARYPLIELLTGVIAVLIVHFNGLYISTLVIFILAAILISIAVVDLDTMTIPDSLILSILPVAVAFLFIDTNIGFLSRVIGFFAISLPMYGSLYFIEDAFGGADIKLFALLGFILGWQKILLTFFIAVVLAAVISILMLKIMKEDYKGKHVPFGPYICMGAFIALLFGTRIINWYLSLF